MHQVQHISIYINCLPSAVYDFASSPQNLPRWAAGLARADVKQDGELWTARAPFGEVKIRFAGANSFGVMDHDVTLESGEVIHNPMRVVPNGNGSEFTFTLIRQTHMSDQQFADDAHAVASDLKRLKEVLERVC